MDPQKYFSDFGYAFANGDTDRLASYHGDSAMSSAPSFVGCLPGKKEIHAAMHLLAEKNKTRGLRSLKPVSIEVQALDTLHSWAKVKWEAVYTNLPPVQFQISYLLRDEPHKTVILFSLHHDDEEKIFRDVK